MVSNEQLLHEDALNFITGAAFQAAEGGVREYERDIGEVMKRRGITVDQARAVLKGSKGSNLNLVLEALTNIESKLQKKP